MSVHAQNISAPTKTCTLSKSVNFKQFKYRDKANQPLIANVIEVDLTDPNTYLRPLGGVGCKKVSVQGSQAKAIAAVNGGYFSSSCKSVSFLKMNSIVKAFNSGNRSALGIDKQERASIKRVPAGKDWPEVDHGIGGIPRIVTDGKVDVNGEGGGASFIKNRAPRTAVGLLDDQHAIIVTVDGRSTASKGISLPALAQLMIDLGAKQAVNLDGGGSTAMWVDPVFGAKGGVVNRPSDGHERNVNAALAVFAPVGSSTKCF